MAILLGLLWYVAIVARYLSDRIHKYNINIDMIDGRFRELKKGVYKIATKIPMIGYKKKPFKALNAVSMEIHTGMFGLLGPNGAGKTTLMRIICGIFEQSYGKIFINGIDTQKKREELQGLIGYLPQEFGTYENLTSWEFLEFQALLKGIYNPKTRSKRITEVLEAVHMYENKDKKIGGFSGGMKQRIGIAQTLLNLPRILVVDEPTAGLDPRERIRFRNLLVELSRNRIVIFSTHIIEDIASSCNQVGVINKGSLKYHGTPSEMVEIAKDVTWTFEIPAREFVSGLAENIRLPIFADPVSTAKAEKLRPVLGKLHTLKPNRMEAELLSGVTIRDEADVQKAAKVLLNKGVQQVYISLGSDGMYAEDQAGRHVRLPCPKVQVVNATGGGDAMAAALAACIAHGKPLAECARKAAGAGALACTAAETIHPGMSWENVDYILDNTGMSKKA